MRQAGQQPKVEFFAESETEIFLKDVEVLTTFMTNGEGRVTGMVLHVGGRDTPAPKIK
jgi:D-alanyl-D-alanine carboxypeptidase